MRPFLFAFVSLSTLHGAQNVVAIAPAPSSVDSSNGTPWVRVQSITEAAPSIAGSAAGTQEAATIGLFFAGLAGLTVAGGRRRDSEADPR